MSQKKNMCTWTDLAFRARTSISLTDYPMERTLLLSTDIYYTAPIDIDTKKRGKKQVIQKSEELEPHIRQGPILNLKSTSNQKRTLYNDHLLSLTHSTTDLLGVK